MESWSNEWQTYTQCHSGQLQLFSCVYWLADFVSVTGVLLLPQPGSTRQLQEMIAARTRKKSVAFPKAAPAPVGLGEEAKQDAKIDKLLHQMEVIPLYCYCTIGS